MSELGIAIGGEGLEEKDAKLKSEFLALMSSGDISLETEAGRQIAGIIDRIWEDPNSRVNHGVAPMNEVFPTFGGGSGEVASEATDGIVGETEVQKNISFEEYLAENYPDGMERDKVRELSNIFMNEVASEAPLNYGYDREFSTEALARLVVEGRAKTAEIGNKAEATNGIGMPLFTPRVSGRYYVVDGKYAFLNPDYFTGTYDMNGVGNGYGIGKSRNEMFLTSNGKREIKASMVAPVRVSMGGSFADFKGDKHQASVAQYEKPGMMFA